MLQSYQYYKMKGGFHEKNHSSRVKNLEKYSWKLASDVEDIHPTDWAQPKSKVGKPMQPHPKTIDDWKKHFGGLSGDLVHPAGQVKFVFDLSPWAHVDGARYLKLEWTFKPEHPIAPTDPNYPKRRP